jgi:hypothetical protein
MYQSTPYDVRFYKAQFLPYTRPLLGERSANPPRCTPN